MKPHPSIMTRYSALSAAIAREPCRDHHWISPAETDELWQINDQQRRSQWMAGRRMAKQMIMGLTPGLDWSDVEILSRWRRRGHRPQVRVRGDLMDWSLSISHTSVGVLVGLAFDKEMSLGVDLAREVPTDERFRQMWFTPREKRWLAGAPTSRTPILWALKEAVFKAGNGGQAWSPRGIEIVPRKPSEYEVTLFGHRLELQSVDLRAIDDQLAATVCLPREPSSCVELSDASVCL